MRVGAFAAVLAAGVAAVAGGEHEPPLWFVDESAEAGVQAFNVAGSTAKTRIVESTGAGACFFDYDLDDDVDLYVVNGATWETQGPRNPARNTLYRNLGGGRFVDVTAAAGVGDNGWGGGCAVGDYDNDGDPDLYVTNYGSNLLYRNQGDGSFADVTAAAGVAAGGWSSSAVFVDVDADGDLDLFVARYLSYGAVEQAATGCAWKGAPVMCGPRGMTAETPILYRNEGGTFRDVSAESGVAARPGYGLGVVAGDVDADGDADLLVANDSMENFLFFNDGRGGFSEQGVAAGVALSGDGRAQAGMGIELGDADGDGDPDLVVTHFSDDYDTLYRNDGDGLWSDVSLAAGLDPATRSTLGWGVALVDLDNDADLDLVIANGHVFPQVDQADPATSYRQRNLVLQNDGRGRFVDVIASVGPGFAEKRTGRGLAVADYDDDGDVDLMVVNENDTPSLLRNDGGNRLNWVKVRLIGRRSNRDGIGAQLELVASGRAQRREVRLGSGYLSSHDPRVHFGLGTADAIERLTVRWPSGRRQVLEGLRANRLLTVDEERGLIGEDELRGRAAPAPGPLAAPPVLAAAPAPATASSTSSSAAATPRRLTSADLRQIDALVQAGTRSIVAGRYAEGNAAYRRALEALPTWEAASASADALGFGDSTRYRDFLAAVHDNLGVGLMRGGNLVECAQSIEQALAILPGRAKFLHNLGLCHYHGRRYAAAATALAAARAADERRPGIDHDLGRALAMAGRCAEAETQLHAALARQADVDPQGRTAEIWYLLGGCAEAAGDLERAADAYREALATVPGHQKALYKLQSVWRRSGKTAAAEAAYSLFRERQAIDEAIRARQRAGGSSAAYRLALARAFLDAGQPDEAVEEARFAVSSTGGAAPALLLLGEAALALRPPDLARADESFRRALALAADDADALAGIGEVLRRSGRPEEAEQRFRAALAASPGHDAASIGLARLLLQRAQPSDAAVVLPPVHAGAPMSPAVSIARADVLLAAGDAAGALAVLGRDANPYGADVETRLRALARLGRVADARRLLAESPFLGRAARQRAVDLLGER